MEPQTLQKKLRKAWCKETSAYPELWTPEMPEIGQCLPTSLIVKDEFGGELMQGFVKLEGLKTRLGYDLRLRHFWNWFDDGSEMDLTRGQLPENYVITQVKPCDADFVLSIDSIAERYKMLKQRIFG